MEPIAKGMANRDFATGFDMARTLTYVRTYVRNVRVQDLGANPSVPYGRKAVDEEGIPRLADAIRDVIPYPVTAFDRMPVLNREERGPVGANRRLWIAMMARDRRRCWMCGQTGTQTVIDHLRPRSNWPADQLHIADRSDNLRIACWECNTDKSNRDVPYVQPLPIVHTCQGWAGMEPGGFFDAYCAQHRHECRVPNGWRVMGLAS